MRHHVSLSHSSTTSTGFRSFLLIGGTMAENLNHRDFHNPAFDKIALELGRVTLAWNDLHVSLSGLFSAILKIPNRLTPGAIWDAIKVDRSQREILLSLSQTNALGHRLPEEAKADIKFLVSQVNRLQEYRNNLIHSPFRLSGSEVIVYHGGTHARGIGISGRDLLKECAVVYQSTMTFRNFASELEEAIQGLRSTWPQRPHSLKEQRCNDTA